MAATTPGDVVVGGQSPAGSSSQQVKVKKRKRPYPAHRNVKSMKKSPIPGVQGFNLRKGLEELEQREYAIKGVEFTLSDVFQERRPPSPLAWRWDLYDTPSVEEEDIPSLTCKIIKTMIPMQWQTPYLFHGSIRPLHRVFRMFNAEEIDEVVVIIIKQLRVHLLDILNTAETALQGCHDDIRDALEEDRPAMIKDLLQKHREFVTFCGSLLHEAKKQDPALFEMLLENDIPRKMWETGWQLFLDHVYSTGQLEHMDTFIQEAYNQVDDLKRDLPELDDHWQKCLRGLGKYLNMLHEYKPWLRKRPLWEEDDYGGGGGVPGPAEQARYGLLDFARIWGKPLSAIAKTVLNGWSIVGATFKLATYMRVGWVFCRVDKP